MLNFMQKMHGCSGVVFIIIYACGIQVRYLFVEHLFRRSYLPDTFQ